MRETFPSSFCLKDLLAISGRALELKHNPLEKEAAAIAYKWFVTFNLYHEEKLRNFLKYGKFDLLTALCFPEADLKHLTTGLVWFLWGFSTDDLSDEGDLQSKPDGVQGGHDISTAVVENPEDPRPEFPYAAMLYDLLGRLRETATVGCYTRFTEAFRKWSSAQVQQAHNRSVKRIPSVQEFIQMRRSTFGMKMCEAMVEYSLDIKLPDIVFDNPIMNGMSTALGDIMIWPNDLCSFNKEQSDDDYQNLVVCIMVEQSVGLQAAVDILTNMFDDRVSEYQSLKKQLPSFGAEIDAELARYLKALEHFSQGSNLWYYESPRYFRTINVSEREGLVVPLFQGPLEDLRAEIEE